MVEKIISWMLNMDTTFPLLISKRLEHDIQNEKIDKKKE